MLRSRSFSVRDSIEMTTFSDPSPFDQQAIAGSSPNKRYFLVVTTRGIIKSNEVESALWAFDANDVRRYLLTARSQNPPRPRLLTRVSAVPRREADRPNAPVIRDLRWTDNSSWIYFLADDSDGNSRLYRIRPDAGGPQEISQPHANITHFDFTSDAVAYTTSAIASTADISRDLTGYPINSESRSITGLPLDSILFPVRGVEPLILSLWIWRNGIRYEIRHKGALLRVLDRDDYSTVLSLSPSGLYAIWSLPVESIPPTWELYTPPPGFEHRRISASDSSTNSSFNANRPREYTLVNLRTGSTIPLVDAPQGNAILYGDVDKAVWSKGGDRLIVTNTLLPLGGVDGPERAERVRPCAAASVDLPSREAQCITFTRDSPTTPEHGTSMRLKSASFVAPNNDVLLVFTASDHHAVYEQFHYASSRRWIRNWSRSDIPEAVNLLTLIVKTIAQ